METPNLIYINNLSGNDEVFKSKLISIVKNEFPQEKAMYEASLASENFKQTAENVHKLKHKISILGLEKSYDIAVEFENNLLEGNTSLREQFESILNNITKYLTTL